LDKDRDFIHSRISGSDITPSAVQAEVKKSLVGLKECEMLIPNIIQAATE
jgi:hypothetical protein